LRRRRRQKRYIEPTALRDLVPVVLRGLRPQRLALEEMGRAWAAVAGEATASRTRIVGLKAGVLTLEVASSALKHDLLTFRRNQLLIELRKMLPGAGIREIKCRVGTLS